MLTIIDLAKYPFTKEAAEYVKNLGLKIDDLTSIEFIEVINRAEERIKEAILNVKISKEWLHNDVEILSFPTAILLLSGIKDEKIKRRYALSEAKRAYEFLIDEENEKILHIAKETFNWKIEFVNTTFNNRFFTFKLHFSNYLRNAVKIKDTKWKLINRILEDGYVYLTKEEASRLLEEEIQRRILAKIEDSNVEIKNNFEEYIKRIISYSSKLSFVSSTELPKTMVFSAFPPCIKKIYESIISGGHASHVERFTLTAFLLNIGLKPEEITQIFKGVSDFNEEKTKYQIEHIAGARGSGIKYVPPKCSTLKTYGICINQDELCSKVVHPLTYYKKALKFWRKKVDRRLH
ncbi:MAG: DNA primase large subunit PriL [Candidatus Bathyarchaeia archaeon]|nr:DNA primase large subunit PriL [Candidatus Bathyarchaeota archaeon]